MKSRIGIVFTLRKRSTGLLCWAALLAAAGAASAAPRQYTGSDSLAVWVRVFAATCGANNPTAYPALAGATPDFDYIGGGANLGGSDMRAGKQDLAPYTRPFNATEACPTSIPVGPQGEPAVTISPAGSQQEHWAIGRDGITIVTSLPNAARCDTSTADDDGDGVSGIGVDDDDFGAALAFSSATTITVNDALDGVTGNSPATYTFNDWRDVLRVLWAGADHLNFTGTNQNAANRVARCGSDIRRSLVANWDNIIEGNAACQSVAGSCQNAAGVGQPLRHIFRRDEAAATADAFLSLLGLNSLGGSVAAGTQGVNEPFCNGKDTDDNDPIRVRCTINNVLPTAPITDNPTQLNDETCGVDQTQGLVLAVRVPSFLGTTNTLTTTGNRHDAKLSELYPQFNCSTGLFSVRRPPAIFNSTQTCPDGAPYLFTGCLTPLAPPGSIIPATADSAAAEADCSCLNAWTNRAPGTPDRNPSIGGLQNDGRVWNRIYRGHPGTGNFGNPANPCPVLRDERGAEVVLGDGRLRARATTVNGLAVPADRVCNETSAGLTEACLSRATECSLGFESRPGIIDVPATPTHGAFNGGTALLVGPGLSAPAGSAAVGPTREAIIGSSASGGYQLARKVYFNSITGFESILPVGVTVGGITGTGTRLPTAAGESNTASLEQAQLVECLLGEDPDIATGPIQTALAATGFISTTLSTARPFLDTAVNVTCP